METATAYNLDSIPVSTLTDRYSIGRTAIYNRINALGIEPEKRGKLSYISIGQLNQLDELDTQLKAGESMPTNYKNALTEHTPNKSDIVLSPSTDSVLLTLATMLKPHSDRLENHADLERCAVNGWLLQSSELRALVGIKPHGLSFTRMGFEFNRVGREWSVRKITFVS